LPLCKEGEDISSLLAGGDDTVKEESTEQATKIHNKKPKTKHLQNLLRYSKGLL
jgi:hypothetical protein